MITNTGKHICAMQMDKTADLNDLKYGIGSKLIDLDRRLEKLPFNNDYSVAESLSKFDDAYRKAAGKSKYYSVYNRMRHDHPAAGELLNKYHDQAVYDIINNRRPGRALKRLGFKLQGYPITPMNEAIKDHFNDLDSIGTRIFDENQFKPKGRAGADLSWMAYQLGDQIPEKQNTRMLDGVSDLGKKLLSKIR